MKADSRKMDARLRRITRRINKLAAGADADSERTTIEYRLSIDDLKAKRAVAEARVEAFKKAGVDEWHEHRAGIEQAWDDVENALRTLRP